VIFTLAVAAAVWAGSYARRARQENAELRALVNKLKDIAWDQRELDPSLSTIIIDEIRTHEKKKELRG